MGVSGGDSLERRLLDLLEGPSLDTALKETPPAGAPKISPSSSRGGEKLAGNDVGRAASPLHFAHRLDRGTEGVMVVAFDRDMLEEVRAVVFARKAASRFGGKR